MSKPNAAVMYQPGAEHIAALLGRLKHEQQMTRDDIATALGVSKTTLRDAATGRVRGSYLLQYGLEQLLTG